MTTHLTKIWWDLNKDKLVEQLIPESEIYKREWVGLTDDEKVNVAISCGCADVAWIDLADAIEAKLKEKNT